MVDLYPATIKDLSEYPQSQFTYPHQPWFYDGAQHFSVRSSGSVRHHYCGVRHRLESTFLDKKDLGLFERLRLRFIGRNKSPSGMLMKPILQKWDQAQYYLDSHRTSLPLSPSVLLPLLHYRYTPGMLRKLEWAIAEGGYAKGNADYIHTNALLTTMREQGASFLGANSIPVSDFAGFVQTGNAKI